MILDIKVFNSLFKKCLLLKKYINNYLILLCDHHLNIRYVKNINLTLSKSHKSFGLKSSFN